MRITENEIAAAYSLFNRIASSNAASSRVQFIAGQLSRYTDVLHGLLCADHMPPPQVESRIGTAEFDLSKNHARALNNNHEQTQA